MRQAVVTLATSLIFMAINFRKGYNGWLLPFQMVLSYLWLTSLIFATQDYSGRRCIFGPPFLAGRCGLKHTVQAFTIITL